MNEDINIVFRFEKNCVLALYINGNAIFSNLCCHKLYFLHFCSTDAFRFIGAQQKSMWSDRVGSGRLRQNGARSKLERVKPSSSIIEIHICNRLDAQHAK